MNWTEREVGIPCVDVLFLWTFSRVVVEVLVGLCSLDGERGSRISYRGRVARRSDTYLRVEGTWKLEKRSLATFINMQMLLSK